MEKKVKFSFNSQTYESEYVVFNKIYLETAVHKPVVRKLYLETTNYVASKVF